MLRIALALVILGTLAPSAYAQSWGWMEWERPGYRAPIFRYQPDDDDDDERPQRPRGQELMDGGPRPDVAPLPPTQISFVSSYAPGTIVIDTAGRRLYLVQSSRSALVYPISVGRVGFTWTGTERISRVASWPDWHPPAEMRQRDPRLPVKMTGGVRNPLGAKALYLGNSLYRIHGTDNARTIGQATSSGCFRMTNGHVVDLARRVGVGTTVVVLNRLPPSIARLSQL
jgi:lipoprotein-anchoring transpeptidase ErfK/SrfK